MVYTLNYFKLLLCRILGLFCILTFSFKIAFIAVPLEFQAQTAVFLAGLEYSNAVATVHESLKLVDEALRIYIQALQSGADQETLSFLSQKVIEAKQTLHIDSLRIWHQHFKSEVVGLCRWSFFEKIDTVAVWNGSLLYSDLSNVSNPVICERLSFLTEFFKDVNLLEQAAENVFNNLKIPGHTNQEMHEIYYKSALYKKELAAIIDHLKTNPEVFEYCLNNYNL